MRKYSAAELFFALGYCGENVLHCAGGVQLSRCKRFNSLAISSKARWLSAVRVRKCWRSWIDSSDKSASPTFGICPAALGTPSPSAIATISEARTPIAAAIFSSIGKATSKAESSEIELHLSAAATQNGGDRKSTR